MYLIVIAWMYVVLMMSVAEATNSNGTLLGAVVTFFMYGVGPAALVAYLMGAPARSRAIKKRHAEDLARHALHGQAGGVSLDPPDAGRHAARGAEAMTDAGTDSGVAPVRKEP
ncbi:MAG: hypothetical protein B7X59_05940 [Polaromonas sp. 39-63-203]|jgi:hypothetical protein|uniref:hypothetical protein n=1 Tax=Polaromonas sp. TaxID=1869339 RepID=UPI000BC82DE3|nr:hypothetical protein [Polaromonas sp.]OYY52649.1 MAG: hypothetical protein B7Y54_06145 [Polaromonas sp. 35-63-240]OYY99647.1 MAG: hypothetical protein B7Y42_05530 [Polaromonas sp. 28-63-22]OYZ83669.1 MAG: hypothetical protein B7Y03_07935 [Polaromonas sp. 24-62-144]OZA98504.1 MAG: hypothetical protein B7X59_05940 [Polaromonas sp. 39-63-203]HQS32726.1 hypothetical protein [Polaromonas sp.]